MRISRSAISSEEAYDVVRCLLGFEDAVRTAARLREPCFVTRYAVDLAEKFNRFYIGHRIIGEDRGATNARLFLAYMTKRTLAAALGLIGISAPESM